MAIERMNLRRFLGNSGLRDRYVAAVLKLKADGIYQIFVDWHADRNVANVAHGNVSFTAWHRIYIRLFEIELQRADQALQTAANPSFDPAQVISLPWWNYPNMNSSNPSHARGRLWHNNFLGPSGPAPSFEVPTGPFGAGSGFLNQHRTSRLSDPPAYAPDVPPNLTRSLASGGSRLPSQAELDHTTNRLGTFDNNAFTEQFTAAGAVPGSSTSDSFRAVLEGFSLTGTVRASNESYMHNGVHGWIGGKMANVPTAPNDPVFWIHHCTIDRLWALWQIRHPSLASQWPTDAAIDAARTTGVSGLVNLNAKRLNDPLTPWTSAGRTWLAVGGSTLMTTEIYTARDVLNWTAMSAGLGSCQFAGVNSRRVRF